MRREIQAISRMAVAAEIGVAKHLCFLAVLAHVEAFLFLLLADAKSDFSLQFATCELNERRRLDPVDAQDCKWNASTRLLRPFGVLAVFINKNGDLRRSTAAARARFKPTSSSDGPYQATFLSDF